MKRDILSTRHCPLARAGSELVDGWTLVLLREVMLGNNRFAGLQEQSGTTAKGGADDQEHDRKKFRHTGTSEWKNDIGDLLAIPWLLNVGDLAAPTIGNPGRGDLVIGDFIAPGNILRADITGHQQLADLEVDQ